MRVLGIILVGFPALPATAQDRAGHCTDMRGTPGMKVSPGSLPERPTGAACLQPQ